MNKASAVVLGLLVLAVGYLYVKPVPAAPAPSLGAVSSLSGNNPGPITVNGLTEYWNATGLITASTTDVVCAIQSPKNATSSLGSASITFTVSTTSASTVTMAKSSSPSATTTIIGTQIPVAAGAMATIMASSTAVQDGANTKVFAPGQWFVVSMGGFTGTYSPTGLCTASFRKVSPGA